MDSIILEAELTAGDPQLVIAREYGFPNWVRLTKHIEEPALADNLNLPNHERIEDAAFRRAVDLLDAGDAEGLRANGTIRIGRDARAGLLWPCSA